MRLIIGGYGRTMVLIRAFGLPFGPSPSMPKTPLPPRQNSPLPSSGGQVSMLQPLLEVTNAKIQKESRLSINLSLLPIKICSRSSSAPRMSRKVRWGRPRGRSPLALKDGKNYYWQAWAIDASGLAGPKMSVVSFSVSLANKPPSVPKPRLPKDGSTVSSLRPKFEVINAIDPEGQPVFPRYRSGSVQTFDSADKSVKGYPSIF